MMNRFTDLLDKFFKDVWRGLIIMALSIFLLGVLAGVIILKWIA